MFNLTLLQDVIITFLSALCGLSLACLFKGSFKKGLTQSDIGIAGTMLIVLPLATFIRSYLTIHSNSWASFGIVIALWALVSTIVSLFINRSSTIYRS